MPQQKVGVRGNARAKVSSQSDTTSTSEDTETSSLQSGSQEESETSCESESSESSSSASTTDDEASGSIKNADEVSPKACYKLGKPKLTPKKVKNEVVVRKAKGSQSQYQKQKAITLTKNVKEKGKAPNKIKSAALKKKRKIRSICLTNCRYEAVRRASKHFNLHEVTDEEEWNIYWTDYCISLERAMELKGYQVVNHFPGMSEICRKDLLARNLNRMRRLFPKDFDISPKTWNLPADLGDLQTYAQTHRNRTYICKPETGCQGKGIFLIRGIRELNPLGKIVCQQYLSKPFLIDGFKFDLRIYVLMTSCDPLRIYVHKEGLGRFATAKYQPPTQINTENSYMHLTNYAVNKHSQDYVVDDEAGSKRKLSAVYNWLKTHGYEAKELIEEIDDVVIKTIISAYPILKHNYKTCFSNHSICSACFEILGFDIIIDHKLKPYVLEVNHSPSFHTDASLDKEIKEGLLKDTFAMLNLKKLDRHKFINEERKRVKERLTQNIKRDQQTAIINEDQNSAKDPTKLTNSEDIQFAHEVANSGGFRLVYPSLNSEKYDQFFQLNLSSLYHGTTASQARAECTRSQLQEYHQKKMIEEKKRVNAKSSPVTAITFKDGTQPRKELNSENETRRKEKSFTICLSHCRYDIVRTMASKYELVEVSEDDFWNIYWTDYSVSIERALDMRRFQIINHFPGMNEICRKDLLARNLNRMKRLINKDYDIYPRTWSLPADLAELQQYALCRRNKIYICKPEMGCQGRGIFLIRNIKDLNPFGKIVCQLYLAKPFLIDGYKFDLRIYALITSCDPLRVYLYKEGLARFATAKYKPPTNNNNTENSYMHLTNYAVNKFSRDYVVDDESGSKRKLTAVYKWLTEHGYDTDDIIEQIDDVIMKTILSAQPILKQNYNYCFPDRNTMSACFEILGFDIILDHKLKPYVLEVNHSPSFHTDAKLDLDIKEGLLNDTFAMLNFKQLTRTKENGSDKDMKCGGDLKEIDSTQTFGIEMQALHELENCGDYRLIYPKHDSAKYDKYFEQNWNAIIQERIAVTTARANATKISSAASVASSEKKLNHAGGDDKATEIENCRNQTAEETALPLPQVHINQKPSTTCTTSQLPLESPTPNWINPAEELERTKAIMQRGMLIRSLGIEIQVYKLLRDMGCIKAEEEKLYQRLYGHCCKPAQIHE